MKTQLKKNTINLAIWTFAWVGTLAIATIGPNELWDNLTLTKIGLVINLTIGIGMLIANKNLFNYYDEFQRKIQLEAIAITLGLTVIVGILFEASYNLGVISLMPKIHFLIFFISITYIISVLLNSRRYK